LLAAIAAIDTTTATTATAICHLLFMIHSPFRKLKFQNYFHEFSPRMALTMFLIRAASRCTILYKPISSMTALKTHRDGIVSSARHQT
jgi:hypothetical protein